MDSTINDDIISLCADQANTAIGEHSILFFDGKFNTNAFISRNCAITASQCEAQFRRIEAACMLANLADHTIINGHIETLHFTYNLTRYRYEAAGSGSNRVTFSRSATELCPDPLDGTVQCKTPVPVGHGRSFSTTAKTAKHISDFCNNLDLADSGDSGWVVESDSDGQTWFSLTHGCGFTAEDCETQFHRIVDSCDLDDLHNYTISGGNISTPDFVYTMQRDEYYASGAHRREAGTLLANSSVVSPTTATASTLSSTSELPPCTSPYDGNAECFTRPSQRFANIDSSNLDTALLSRRDYLSAMSSLCASQVTWPPSQTSVHIDDGSTRLELRRSCAVTEQQCKGQFYHILDTCGLDEPEGLSSNAGRIETADFLYDMFRYVVAED